jgi:hypothetical protein
LTSPGGLHFNSVSIAQTWCYNSGREFAVCKLAVGLFFSALACAEVHSLCVEDRVGLNAFTRKAFEAELNELVRGRLLAPETCPFPAISVVISAHPPARQAKALGLAFRNGTRVLPEIRIFTQPVLRVLGTNVSAAQLGRALARVAAHELEHNSAQRLHHDHKGLMKAAFDGLHLAADDSNRFRPPPKH